MTTDTDLGERPAAGRDTRVPVVRATVVRAERPTSAKPGDSAVIFDDGRVEGFVGGACALTTVRTQALEALASGEARLVRIAPSDVDEPARAGEVTVVNPCLSGGTLEIFLQPDLPPARLVVFGDGPIARALERLGAAADLQVSRSDDAASVDLAGCAAVVVASHGHEEEALLTRAVQAGVPYVGLVASRRRGAAVVEALALSADERARIRTPAGLDIGATRPAEIAVSVLAELISRRPRAPQQRAAAEPPPAAAMATDPVCGMTVPAVESSLFLDVDGDRIWFCGSGCRTAFADDPARYRR